MIKTLAKSIREFKLQSFLSAIFVALEVVFEVSIPWVMARLIDYGIEKSDMAYVYRFGVILFVFAILQMLCGIACAYFATVAGSGFGKNLRRDLFKKIQEFSFQNVDTFSAGSLVTRLTEDVTFIQQAFQMMIRGTVRGIFMLIFSIAAAFLINARIARIFVIVAFILAIGITIISRLAFPIFDKLFKAIDKMNNCLSENIRAIRVVKTFNREEYEINKFTTITDDIKKYSVKGEQYMVLGYPAMQLVSFTCIIAVAWIGSKAVIASGNNPDIGFTTGQMMSLIAYGLQILMSLMMTSMAFVMFIISAESAKRIYEVLSTKSNITDKPNPITEIKDGSIEFKNVNFKYVSTAQKNVLSNINLKIESGQTIGIMGATGSGKTSLISLLPRFYDTMSGEVIVGGVNVKDYQLKALRDSIGMVLQKNVLFSGTIAENLRFGNKSASYEDMARAADIACASEFINEKQDKYDSVVEQGGSNFSGGQRQRLCIARAILKNPKILIFDDSTSAVDTKTESKIRSGLKDIYPDVTKIIIAQRVSSVMEADKIIIMDDGKIIAFGTHNELLKTSEIYRDIYETQVKEAA